MKAGKGHFDKAKEFFMAFMKHHPLDRRNPHVSLLLGKLEEERKEDDEAMRLYQECSTRYKGSKEASEAAYRKGLILETKKFQPALAAAVYQRVKGSWAFMARQRIQDLIEQEFELKTERVFRTDEQPEIMIRSKNIKKLRVRIYGLDWERFFRGRGESEGVEDLAIEEIQPKRSFQYWIKGFKPYTGFVNKIPMPAGNPGTWLVKVDDGTREATTLVVVSDLVLIRKALAKEIFVFAMDEKKQRPLPGVRILFSNGKKVVAEKETDSKRACRYALPDSSEGDSWEVFGVLPQGVAQGGSGELLSSSVTGGFVAKSVLFTDRPAYRPGERMGAQCVLRNVHNGSYVPPPVMEYSFLLQDPLGRIIARKHVESNAFGTVKARFLIPGNPKVGSWTLLLKRRKDGVVMATREVKVLDFKPPAVSLKMELAHRTITRGEVIEGKVRARYFFGGPVKNRRISVRLSLVSTLHVLEGTTNGAGEFGFRFETNEIFNAPILRVEAYLPEEGARDDAMILIREQGFEINLKFPEGLVLAGETVEVKVEAKTYSGKPLRK